MRHDTALLRRLELLITRTRQVPVLEEDTARQQALSYTVKFLGRLSQMLLEGQEIFSTEPWHRIHDAADLNAPAEMLLRVKAKTGEAMPPYPAVMALYESGLAPLLDTVLCLAAFREARNSGHKQLSLNISSRSLRDSDFIRCALKALNVLNLSPREKIIFEIHEGTGHMVMNPMVLDMFRKKGIGFAIDDLGLSMQDVFRLSEFQGIADYIKIDRRSVCAQEHSPFALSQVLSFVATTLPDVKIIAEGVQDVEHAIALQQQFPNIHYVQGLYLPSRQEFKMHLARLTKKSLAPPAQEVSERFDMAALH